MISFSPGHTLLRLFALNLFVSLVWLPNAFSSDSDNLPAEELRVIAYNIYNGNFWPRDGALSKEAKAKGQFAERLALELSLHNPDIVTFSESPAEAITKDVAKRLGMNHVRFPSAGNWPGTLLSRFEIVDSRNLPIEGERPKELFTRHWGKATVRLPDGTLLVVHTAHLHPGGANSEIRMKEIAAMLESMADDIGTGHSVLLTGDLNHLPDTPEYRMWTDAGWIDTFPEAGVGSGLTIRADEPARRIDYVMAIGPIAGQIKESRALYEGAFRTNQSDPSSFALSDHLPQLAIFDLTDKEEPILENN